MADHHEDDVHADQTEGFKVGEKKTLDEYHQLGVYSICATSPAWIGH